MSIENQALMKNTAAQSAVAAQDSALPVLAPATDVYETDQAIQLYCDMPGVDEKNIDVTLENDVLTIKGVQAVRDYPGYNLVFPGYERVEYRRSFTIAAAVDHGKLKARLANGVLEVTLVKSAKNQPQKIRVET